MVKPVTQDFIGLDLSADELRELTNWPEPVINAFISLAQDLITTAQSIDSNIMQVGTGSPEGSVTSNKSRQYFDSSAGTLYINPAVGADSGWVAV
jgi:hypothetical protein